MAILALGSSEQEFAFVCTLIAVNSFGSVFNGLIICMFVRFRKHILASNKNLLLLSMSVADLCVGVTGTGGGLIFFFMKKKLTTVTVYKLGGLLPIFGSFFMSILSLGLITTERLVAIQLPLRHRLMMTRERVKLAICVCWLIVISLMTINGILFLYASAWIELQVRCLMLGIFFVVGSIILSASNLVLYRIVQNRALKHCISAIGLHYFGHFSQVSRSKELQRFEATKRKDETSSARVCIWMTVLFIVCWLPVTIYYLVWLALTANPAGRIGLTVCFALAGLNSFLNPVIYLFHGKDFRSYFQKMICGKVHPVKDRSHTVSSSC